MMITGLRTKRKAKYPPGTVRSLYELCMSYPLYQIALRIHIDMCKNRIGGIRLVGAVYMPATGNSNFMPVFRAPFGNQQIIPIILFINMRCFGIASTGTIPYTFRFGQLLTGHRIYLTQLNAVVRIADQIAFPSFEIKRRIDATLLN